MGKGLRYDRRWMLVDKNGKFLTQRVHPTMALFKLSMDDDTLTVRFKEYMTNIPLKHSSSSDSLRVQIWDDTVEAVEVGTEYSQWFTMHLGIECRLVHFPEENARPVDPTYKVNDEHVSLADAYPFLIIGQRSLDDLNKRLG
ncbi:MAG: MOSC domain-containing protein, partial [Marivirga sp.]|nr:MOSC domain-containing protein [Marivirga sp.]